MKSNAVAVRVAIISTLTAVAVFVLLFLNIFSGTESSESRVEKFKSDSSISRGTHGGAIQVYDAWNDCATMSEESGGNSWPIIAKRVEGRWVYFDSKIPTVDKDEVKSQQSCLSQAAGSARSNP